MERFSLDEKDPKLRAVAGAFFLFTLVLTILALHQRTARPSTQVNEAPLDPQVLAFIGERLNVRR